MVRDGDANSTPPDRSSSWPDGYGLTHVAAGEPIPPVVHGVSVSLPDVATVVGFEGHDPEVLRRVRRGYPRFRAHPYVSRLAQLVQREQAGRDAELVLTRSGRAARAAAAYGSLDPAAAFDVDGPGNHGFGAVVVPDDSAQARCIRDFVQHAGCHLSSRHAEDALVAAGYLPAPAVETAVTEAPGARIAAQLAAAYGAGVADISLHNSGMNAVFAAVSAIDDQQRPRGRRRWIQLGWMFFDTVKLLEKRIVDVDLNSLPTPWDVDAAAAAVAVDPSSVAGIVVEVPSNPLIQTPDLLAIREIADRVGAALVVDATIGTPHNVAVLDLADVVCESLTKYAAGSADVLMGAAVVNAGSPHAAALREGLWRHGEIPYHRDLARMAARIDGYAERMDRVNANAVTLAEVFASRPEVRAVHWAYEPRSEANYRKLERRPDSPGGLLMLDLAVPLERVYDHLPVPKGPSFGAEFTMASAQVFTAHFDLMSTPAGRDVLRAHGLHRDMLRVSVGTEPVDWIAAAFDEAFSKGVLTS